MRKRTTILAAMLSVLSVAAFGQTVDPVGFCPNTSTSCFTGTGIGNETIAVGTTSFIMEKNGNSAVSSNPWYLLLIVPEATLGTVTTAPTLTSASFNGGSATSGAFHGQFLPSTGGSVYSFLGLTGDASINGSNLFGANEQLAFGGTPAGFAIFQYTFAPAFQGAFTPYAFTVGGSLAAGTFLAAAGGSNPFSTPYTTVGLVNGPPGNVPEPTTIVLLGTVSAFVLNAFRKKVGRG